MIYNAQLLNDQCIEIRIQKCQSKAPTPLERWPLLPNSKSLVVHLKRDREETETDRDTKGQRGR